MRKTIFGLFSLMAVLLAMTACRLSDDRKSMALRAATSMILALAADDAPAQPASAAPRTAPPAEVVADGTLDTPECPKVRAQRETLRLRLRQVQLRRVEETVSRDLLRRVNATVEGELLSNGLLGTPAARGARSESEREDHPVDANPFSKAG